MNTDRYRWRAAMECLDRAKDLSELDRQPYLDQLATTDSALHSRVQALLENEKLANSQEFLEPDSAQQGDSQPPILQAGMKLGRYSILSLLGQGGMGEVWLAQRDDGLYEGKAAIKILQPHFTNSALRDRFRREAKLLGRLVHPSIAQLLDVGIADAASFGLGASNEAIYLVLEYVPGLPIDLWCDQQRLGVKQRVQLFIKLCEAVAHAHANLVVHRDLKPSNVLITKSGQLKLLDFGIGKLVEQDQITQVPQVTKPSELTKLSGRIFTPEYAAPEQIIGEGVTTGTDIFTLGTLLYYLLSGNRPFVGASPVATEHAVLHLEPESLVQVARSATSVTLAARATSAKQLQRELAGDLECIVTRALRKQSKQRYASVAALIEDLQRYLDHQPVLARTGSLSYVIRRFVQRHRVAVIATAGVLISIMAGLSGVIWNANVAREQARIAQEQTRIAQEQVLIATSETNKATAVKKFLTNIFEFNSDKQPGGASARQTTAEEILDIATNRILAEPVADFELQDELLLTLAGLNQKLEKYDRAETLDRQRVHLLQAHLEPGNQRIFGAQLNLAIALLHREKYAEIQTVLDALINAHRKFGIQDSIQLGRAETLLGEIAYMQANPGDPEPTEHYRKAIAILEKYPDQKAYLVDAFVSYSRALNFLPDYEQGAAVGLRAIAEATAIQGLHSTTAADAHTAVTEAFTKLAQFDRAEYHARQAIEIQTFVKGPGTLGTLEARVALANVWMEQGKHLQAAQEINAALSFYAKAHNTDLIPIQYVRLSLAQSQQEIGDLTGALKTLQAASSVPNVALDPNLQNLLNLQMAALRLEQGQAAGALAFSQRGIDLISKNVGQFDDNGVAQALIIHAEILTMLGRHADAQSSIERIKQLNRRLERRIVVHQTLAAIRIAEQRKQYDVASSNAEQLLSEFKGEPGSETGQRWWSEREAAYRYLSIAQRALGKTRDSCESLRAAIELRSRYALVTDPRLLQAQEEYRHCR